MTKKFVNLSTHLSRQLTISYLEMDSYDRKPMIPHVKKGYTVSVCEIK